MRNNSYPEWCIYLYGTGTGENTTVPTNGLVAYYPFNGIANDESGNGNPVCNLPRSWGCKQSGRLYHICPIVASVFAFLAAKIHFLKEGRKLFEKNA